MSKKKNKCSLRVHDGKKWLYGMAAVTYDLNHNYEGYDDFREKIITYATNKAIQQLTPIIYDEIVNEMNKKKLKVVK